MSKPEFDKVADIYDETIPCHIRSHYLNKRRNFIKKYFAKGLVLDTGCGTGLLAGQLIKDGFKVVGLDISLKMLDKARARSMLLVCASADKLPFKSGSFDLVISIVALHHIAYKEAVFNSVKEMARVKKPQGKIIIWDHNPLNPYWPLFMRRLPQDEGFFRLVGADEIVKGLEEAGIENISVKRLGFVPDFIPGFLLRPWQILEKIAERLPLLNFLCAHNVIVG